MRINYNGNARRSKNSVPKLETINSGRPSTERRNDTNIMEETPVSNSLLGFQGLIKTPMVLVTKINPTSYLNGGKKPRNIRNVGPRREVEKRLHRFRLSQRCEVRLLRDDLEKLKASLNSSNSDSDTSNPSEMIITCRICKKSYSCPKKLQNHQKSKHIILTTKKTLKRVSFSDHVIVHEVKEYHKCRKCTKIFNNYKSLKVHMKCKHKKRKCYICNYCDKKFVDRTIFKVHIKLHCDTCGEIFTNKSKFLTHRREVCRIIKLHKCRTCLKAFYRVLDLKDHSYDHNEPCLVCNFCKDQFQSKCMIAHHISFLHSSTHTKKLYNTLKVGNQKLYVCNFCEEASADETVLEDHIQQLPDLSNINLLNKEYYSCNQCNQKYKTEREMLQHKWTHFLSDKTPLKSILSKSKSVTPVHNKPSLVTEESKQRKVNTIFNINNVPQCFKPVVVLERIEKPNIKYPIRLTYPVNNNLNTNEANSFTENPENTKLFKLLNNETELNVNTSENIHKVNNTTVNTIKINTLTARDPTDSHLPIDSAIVHDPVKANQEYADVTEIDISLINPSDLKHALVDKKSKKTLISKHKCETCGKYFSTNYCLNRHITTQHFDYHNLRCKICEEVFVWPSLLRSHRCIRLNLPEMPFDDARPEIQFETAQRCIEEFQIMNENESYDDAVDFEIPAPLVELTESDATILTGDSCDESNPMQNARFKVVMQEVPIEF